MSTQLATCTDEEEVSSKISTYKVERTYIDMRWYTWRAQGIDGEVVLFRASRVSSSLMNLQKAPAAAAEL